MRFNLSAAASILLLILGAAFATSGTAQPSQELLPEESATKAKHLLQQVIGALGGQAYLDVRETDCEGRVAQFGNNGDLMGFTLFHDLWLLPDKNRTEYISKGESALMGYLIGEGPFFTHGGTMITLFSGDEGWMLDKGGVTSQTEDMVKTFVEQVQTNMNNVLRSRVNEPGSEVLYGGTDLIDLKEAEWIEFTDRDHREMRLAVDKSTHLPLRWVVETRDPETRERTENMTTYAQYQPMDGVRTPLNLIRSHNDRKLSQTFLTSCKYNTNLAPQLFTRAALDQKAPEIVKKGYKEKKDSK